ncbi:MAG: DUF3370 domain-containing protein [Leptolyngbyaceae cyanobacterium RU_5_1]|nr:DUF3370 domain-containing protein [Leptolyngbyaceae cyanobacterium RU_5_1]NJR53307.1 DUF3370 domain-containing protein [Acaryochloris sp. CRU_2_0]
MLPFIPAFLLAQSSSILEPKVVVQPQEVRPLSGQLDNVLVFNSNSPEVVQTEGILLSTFPTTGKATPDAHLNQPLGGRFDIFAHHIAKATAPNDLKTLYMGIILHNSGKAAVTVNVLQGASYLSQPDAPFIELDDYLLNPKGTVFAGPGGRVTDDVLRGKRQDSLPTQIVIPGGESRMLLNVPIPVKGLDPPINGRSTLVRLRSNGSIYAASLAMFAQTDTRGEERTPTLSEWEKLLKEGKLAGPRDKTPTPPKQPGSVVYSRVAGVAKGSLWRAQLSDNDGKGYTLKIPEAGKAYSYVLSSVDRGTLGTQQIQSAPMVVRYPDTAYAAHGNYGIQYSLNLPLQNPTAQRQKVAIKLQTPLKNDQKQGNLQFFQPPAKQVFFRGTVRARYQDDQGRPQTRYVHLVQHRGKQAPPLVEMELAPQDIRLVQVDFLYPPDSTPPQVLTVETQR